MCATVSEQRLVEVRCRKAEQESILGNIYVGRVQKVVPNIRAAFIEIQPGLACYYSMEEAAEPIFCQKDPFQKTGTGRRTAGTGDKGKCQDKSTYVSANLNVTGRYLVLTSGRSPAWLFFQTDQTGKKNITGKYYPVAKTKILESLYGQMPEKYPMNCCYRNMNR